MDIRISLLQKLLSYSDEVVMEEGKSVDLLKELIERYSPVGSVIADFFFGSGSTIQAAIELGRKFGVVIVIQMQSMLLMAESTMYWRS